MRERSTGATRQGGSRPAAVCDRREEAGLTLIEVLIAVMVLAVGLLAVAGMAGAVASETQMGGNVTGQTAAGQDVLEELRMRDFAHADLAPGTEEARHVTVASRTYTVTYEVSTVIAGELREVAAVVEATRDLPPDTLSTLVARTKAPAPIP